MSDGKTANIAVLAERVYAQTGRMTRVYVGDGGGWHVIAPHVSAGLIEIVDLTDQPRPWEWFDKIVKGKVPEGTGWSKEPRLDNIGVVVYEGITGFGDILMQDLAEQTADGTINVGGGANVSFKQGDVKVGGNNVAHYGVVQNRLASGVSQSQRLPVDFVVWTALAKRGQDQDTLGTILGPQAVGKSLTSDLPRWFNYTFRLMAVPGNPVLKTQTEYRLYLRAHVDATAQNAKGVGNIRTPLDAAPLPEFIKPANISVALDLIEKAQQEATAKVQARVAQARAAQAKVG